uniref:Chromatin-remodeling ATPase INO80 n=1 Tax=Phallusia mammillata TaxID=59560 RepID=A0A6F9DFW7_9ASCI|nr:helicase SWR1 [Phallusia mammillata]
METSYQILEALDPSLLYQEICSLAEESEDSSSEDEEPFSKVSLKSLNDSSSPLRTSPREWLRELLQEESSDSDDSCSLDTYLQLHQTCQMHEDEIRSNPSLSKYMHYSSDIILGEKKWNKNSHTSIKSKKIKTKGKAWKTGLTKLKESSEGENIFKKRKKLNDDAQDWPSVSGENISMDTNLLFKGKISNKKKSDVIRRKLWRSIAKKDIPKAYRQKCQNKSIKHLHLKKVAKECFKKVRARAIDSRQRSKRESKISCARRMTREAQVFWKKYYSVEKSQRKRAEKQALVQRKLDDEIREAQRQRRKLNYLITQTELYAHFMSRKLKAGQMADDINKREVEILSQINDSDIFSDEVLESFEDTYSKENAFQAAQNAYHIHQNRTTEFSNNALSESIESSNLPQPVKLVGKLTGYQLEGVNWLAGLYAHGLNGILADDMGLGKTVQAIAFLAHLTERVGIWGPFLVVAPASTLNNWHQEFARFLPSVKVLPYWGNTAERKILRLFWNQKPGNNDSSAPFHVLVTSYQLVISDVRYFQRIQWQYMILDEAHALKSTSSIRWKTLLDFNCRNRLLLTGTPIQNTMAELWALLHFIMPTLFDNHAEFNEWFSKDIEYHAENKSTIDEKHLSRLHMILKPFMLRRLKCEVEHELTEKIEIRVLCQLAPRQRMLYDALQKNITFEDLLRKSNSQTSSTGGGNVLMNLVMQFRKMCNHPDLFKSHDVCSSYLFTSPQYTFSKLCFHAFFHQSISSRSKLLYHDFNIHSESNVYRSLQEANSSQSPSAFSFLPFIGLSLTEYKQHFSKSNVFRCQQASKFQEFTQKCVYRKLTTSKSKIVFRSFAESFRSSKSDVNTCTSCDAEKNVSIVFPTLHNQLHMTLSRDRLRGILFCCYIKDFFSHVDFTVTSLLHTEQTGHVTDKRKSTGESTINLEKQNLDEMFQQRVITGHMHCQASKLSETFRKLYLPKVYSLMPELYCNDREAAHVLEEINVQLKCSSFLTFNPISIPDRECLVSDSGKLKALDMLLRRLKDGGHRVLIYSQMTKMIDILEEYMVLRRHTYVRLDGSSRISSRRDTVAGFQACNDIFVFLLSTRAGGLGINLTAADTVIFFDSDWNPTVDQQAMDRAHRLGQTKQVTVYRLVCQGTVDERILQRAEEKSAIQQMVISGGNFKADSLKPKEVVSLLLDDQNMARELNETDESASRKHVFGDQPRKKRGRKSNREKELERAKRIKELQTSARNPEPAFPLISLGRKRMSSKPVSRESSPICFIHSNSPSELSCSGDSRGGEDEPLIVVDEILNEPTEPKATPSVRARRGRGRPRIRPLIPRKSPIASGSRMPRSRAGRTRGKRGHRAFSGRAAAMAGARAGAAAASAAAFAAYGYNYSGYSGTS